MSEEKLNPEVNEEEKKACEKETASRTKPEIAPVSTVEEKDDGYQVAIELPGVPREAIDLSLENRTLSVTAENTVGSYEGYTRLRHEAPEVRYRVTFSIPEQVDETAIQAAYKNGVLTLTLPKRKTVKTQKIAIAE